MDFHGGCGFDKSIMSGRLRAVGAILGTTSSFDREEGALLDLTGVPVHAVGGGCLVHEFMEGEVVDGGYFGLGPVVADGGGDVAHGAGFFVGVEGVALAIIVGEAVVIAVIAVSFVSFVSFLGLRWVEVL